MEHASIRTIIVPAAIAFGLVFALQSDAQAGFSVKIRLGHPLPPRIRGHHPPQISHHGARHRFHQPRVIYRPVSQRMPRYRMVSVRGTVLLLDTLTGQTWSPAHHHFYQYKARHGRGSAPQARFSITIALGKSFILDTHTGQVWHSGTHDFARAKAQATYEVNDAGRHRVVASGGRSLIFDRYTGSVSYARR